MILLVDKVVFYRCSASTRIKTSTNISIKSFDVQMKIQLKNDLRLFFNVKKIENIEAQRKLGSFMQKRVSAMFSYRSVIVVGKELHQMKGYWICAYR